MIRYRVANRRRRTSRMVVPVRGTRIRVRPGRYSNTPRRRSCCRRRRFHRQPTSHLRTRACTGSLACGNASRARPSCSPPNSHLRSPCSHRRRPRRPSERCCRKRRSSRRDQPQMGSRLPWKRRFLHRRSQRSLRIRRLPAQRLERVVDDPSLCKPSRPGARQQSATPWRMRG
jgi:hypothetical protein